MHRRSRRLWLIALPALAYQVLAIAASVKHLRRRAAAGKRRTPRFQPPVSVLKPLHGLDPNTRGAFHSQADQIYPEFELLFGVADAGDPAAEEVRALQRNYGKEKIRLIVGTESLPNGKVGVLANLAKHARYRIWVVNDSDIHVTPDYLAQIVEALRDSRTGVVTCLYRPRAHSLASAWEALGVATDFMPSTLVAQLLGVREFGLGSTVAFRAEDLESAGGFARIGAYLADDYQLARSITSVNGKRTVLSTYTVETSLGDQSWRGVWQHQLRWARTIRASKGTGFAGLPIAQGGVWIALALATGAVPPAMLLLALRLASALLAARAVLGSASIARFFWLAPVWDLYSFAVWLASYARREVRWRDKLLRIDSAGRIVPGITDGSPS